MFKNIARWLQYRRLPPGKSATLQAYHEALDGAGRYAREYKAKARTLKVTHECGDLPLMAGTHPNRWVPGSRDQQYAKLREIIEAIGTPLKDRLIKDGFREENVSARFTFGVKLAPDDEVIEIEAGAAELDYDPAEARRQAHEYNTPAKGFDRMLWWDHVFTLGGRVHGYFKADEDSRFSDAWRAKHGAASPKASELLLNSITLTLHARP